MHRRRARRPLTHAPLPSQLASLPKVPPLPTAVAASPAALLVPGAALVSEPTPIIEDADERASDTESAGDDSLSAAVAAKLVEGASDEKLLRLMQGVGALPGDKREIDVAGGAAENEEKHQDATIEREKLRLQVPALTPVSAPAAAPYSAHSTSSANSTAPSSPDSAGAVSLPSPRSRTRTFGLPRPTSRADSVSSVASAPAGPVGGSGAWADRTIEEIRTLQRNLDERLRAFWTTRMEGREARVEITPVFAGEENTPGQAARSGLLATTSLWSDSTGQISHDLVIPWHVLSAFCKSHQPVAQGRHPNQITALDVRALLMPRKTPAQRAYDWAAGAIENADGLQAPAHDAAAEAPPIQTGWQRVTISEDAARKVRVISDVDDTVKVSGVIEGVRRMFHNVFVRDYTECAVPGVADWYGAMSAAGAGVHYVSNAPLELHSLVRGFLRAAGLPDGHVHLKHYPTGGRSLFAAWWEPASDRKRAAVQAILNAFPRSRFLLIGDSGELDLELYTALAAERPEQIAAIFIRDVSSPPRAIANFSSSSSSSSARRPAHPAALAAGDRVAPPKPAAVQNNAPETPPRTKRLGADDSGRAASQPAFFSPSFPPNVAPTATSASGGSRYSSPQRADPSTTFNPAGAPDPSVSVSSQTPSQNREAAPAPRPQPLTENEIRRVAAFSSRVTRARAGVPRGTRLRFFTDAKECEEEALRLIREIQRGTR